MVWKKRKRGTPRQIGKPFFTKRSSIIVYRGPPRQYTSSLRPATAEGYLRMTFQIPDDVFNWVSDNVSQFLADKVGTESSAILSPIVKPFLPKGFWGPGVKGTVAIDAGKNVKTGTVRFSVPIDLGGHPILTKVQGVLGMPVIYVNLLCSVRVNLSRRTIKMSKISLSLSQHAEGKKDDTLVEWQHSL